MCLESYAFAKLFVLFFFRRSFVDKFSVGALTLFLCENDVNASENVGGRNGVAPFHYSLHENDLQNKYKELIVQI